MIDWIKTAQGLAAIIAALFASMVAWWNLGLPRLVFSPEAPIHTRIETLERLNRDIRLLMPAQAWWRAPIRSGCSGRRGVRCSSRQEVAAGHRPRRGGR